MGNDNKTATAVAEDDTNRQNSMEKSGAMMIEQAEEIGALDTIEDTKPGAFVWLCAAATAIGGMLFGYDTGVISGVLVVLGTDLGGKEVTDSQKEAITALCAAGALVGAIIAGITSDKYGRRPAIWFASVLFTLGAIVQSSSFTIAQMCAGRFLIGLGVGSASMIVPLYIAEVRRIGTHLAHCSHR